MLVSHRLAAFWQDLRFALRGARRTPGFTLLVVATLALGIGATTSVFGIVRGVLLRPLPFPEAERVVRLWPAKPDAAAERGQVSVIELEDWQRELRGFSAVGAYRVFGTGSVFGDGPDPSYVTTAYVSAGFFPAVATPAALGRTLAAGENVPGADHAVVVSHGFWRRQLGGDAAAVGRTIRLDGKPFTVVGVMPPSFAYPAPEVAVWMPTSLLGPDDRGDGREARWLEVVARLRPGVAPAEGRAQLGALLARLAADHPTSNAGWTVAGLTTAQDALVGSVRRGLLVLLGAVGLVLLVACANVANLVLVRGTGRARELALRSALGARRTRVVRQLLTESVVLALAGGALGVLLAWWAVRAFVTLGADFLPRAADVRLDAGVLAFAVGVSVLTGVAFGLWPALRAAADSGLAPALREGGRGSVGAGGAARRARSALVAIEVALSVVLVIGAGLMLRSFQRLTATDPGFRPDNVLLVRFALRFEDSEGAGPLIAARRRIVERVRAVPGVLAAGATKAAPLSSRDLNGEPLPFTVPGRPAPAPGEEPRVLIQPVSPGYLRTLGIPLLAGEDIQSAAGDSNPAPVAVISRRMADRMWPGQSAVGQSFLLGKTPVRVAGVAGDVRNVRLDSVAGFTAYLPDEMMPRSAVSLVVRTAGDPARLADAVRAAVREAMPGQAFQEVVPLRAKVSDAASTARLFTTLVTVFGLVALTLAAVGLYGVVSYVVRQREREIGVRLALGAPPRRVLALVVRQGMTPVVAGLGIGLVAAVGVTRVLRVLLFEVSATDPLTFVAVSVLLGLVALAAAFLPSRRASRVHPAVTLRAD